MTQEKALKVLKSGANTFLTGEPGAGKTHTINLFTDWLRSKGIPYAVTASTGIAATHINGVTIHSFSGLGIKEKITPHDLDLISQKPHIVNQLNGIRVLIIDEISMLDGSTLDNIEQIITHIRGTTLTGEPFGGLQMIFVGDFYQLPPVARNRKARFAFDSWSWEQAKPVTCYLTEQHRQSEPEFMEILHAMRNGKVTKEHKQTLLLQAKTPNETTTKLYTHNRDVDDENTTELAKIKDRMYEFRSTSKGVPYLIDMLKKNCLSPEVLQLKIGALVMFTRNNFDEGYVNGTIGTVIDFYDNGAPVVETKDGKRILVERAKWSIGEGESEAASVTQFPLRLAWAVTVHKSQGMSLDEAIVDLSNCFEYGQGYVAISRVRSLKGLFLRGINEMTFQMHPDVIEQDKLFRISSDEMDKKFE